MANLVGDGESGETLVDENEPIQPLQQRQADDYNDPNWEPEPIDAGPGVLCPPLEPALFILTLGPADFRSNKPTDIISTLVSIYDSKDLFVKELQVLLAQRLLAVTDGNYEKEVRGHRNRKRSRSLKLGIQRRNIEILKIRFGEAALQVCEVMLRDMTDSRRIDQHVQAQKQVRAQIEASKECEGMLTRSARCLCIPPSCRGTSGLRCRRAVSTCPASSRSM